MFKNVPCLFPPHAKMDHYTISSGRNKNVTPPTRQTLRQTLRGTGAEKAFWQPKTSPKQLPKQGGAMKMSTEERKFGKREKREKENSHNFGQNAFALVGVGTFFMPSFNACFASSTSWLVGIFTGSGKPGGSVQRAVFAIHIEVFGTCHSWWNLGRWWWWVGSTR